MNTPDHDEQRSQDVDADRAVKTGTGSEAAYRDGDGE